MSRLAATAGCDLRVQLRNGFYYASGVVVAALLVLLAWLPDPWVAWLLPVVILQNVVVNAFYFVGGLILLEKTERTLAAQAVTPLRTAEYLASKVITLGVLSVVESLVIAVAALGVTGGLALLAAGVVLATALLCLAGVIVVVRYESINEYLMPSVVYTFILTLPLLGYFGVGPSWPYLLHPMQGPLDLMRAAFEPVAGWRLALAVVWPALWIGPLLLWSRRALRGIVA